MLTPYGLGLMVTKRAPQVDGRMDGRTDATRPILLTQLSAELKMGSLKAFDASELRSSIFFK
jgi:hypothetical protein